MKGFHYHTLVKDWRMKIVIIPINQSVVISHSYLNVGEKIFYFLKGNKYRRQLLHDLRNQYRYCGKFNFTLIFPFICLILTGQKATDI